MTNRVDHSDHDHPNTPKARAACRRRALVATPVATTPVASVTHTYDTTVELMEAWMARPDATTSVVNGMIREARTAFRAGRYATVARILSDRTLARRRAA